MCQQVATPINANQALLESDCTIHYQPGQPSSKRVNKTYAVAHNKYPPIQCH